MGIHALPSLAPRLSGTFPERRLQSFQRQGPQSMSQAGISYFDQAAATWDDNPCPLPHRLDEGGRRSHSSGGSTDKGNGRARLRLRYRFGRAFPLAARWLGHRRRQLGRNARHSAKEDRGRRFGQYPVTWRSEACRRARRKLPSLHKTRHEFRAEAARRKGSPATTPALATAPPAGATASANTSLPANRSPMRLFHPKR